MCDKIIITLAKWDKHCYMGAAVTERQILRGTFKTYQQACHSIQLSLYLLHY